jgi:hypothetical protein
MAYSDISSIPRITSKVVSRLYKHYVDADDNKKWTKLNGETLNRSVNLRLVADLKLGRLQMTLRQGINNKKVIQCPYIVQREA